MNEFYFLYIYIFFNLTHADLQCIQINLRLIWNFDITIERKVRISVRNQSFRIGFELPNLRFCIFKVMNIVCNLTLFMLPFFRSLAIFNSIFFKKLKMIWILIFKTRFRSKESYEKGAHASYNNKFWWL